MSSISYSKTIDHCIWIQRVLTVVVPRHVITVPLLSNIVVMSSIIRALHRSTTHSAGRSIPRHTLLFLCFCIAGTDEQIVMRWYLEHDPKRSTLVKSIFRGDTMALSNQIRSIYYYVLQHKCLNDLQLLVIRSNHNCN